MKKVAFIPYVKRMRRAAPSLWRAQKANVPNIANHGLLRICPSASLAGPSGSSARGGPIRSDPRRQSLPSRPRPRARRRNPTSTRRHRTQIQPPRGARAARINRRYPERGTRLCGRALYQPRSLRTRRFSPTDALCSHPLPTGDLPARNPPRKWVCLSRLPHRGHGQFQTDSARRYRRFFGHRVFGRGLFSADPLWRRNHL